ncbi:MAG: radical SAM protein [Hyphomicrobiales bacterium]|nr:radical SAM protein [Hyphomicrobiales bacterium]
MLFARLTEDWRLRGWTDAPRTIVRWQSADYRPLSDEGSYVLSACDGVTNFHSLAFLPHHLRILDDLVSDGIARYCDRGDAIEGWQRHRFSDNPVLRSVEWNITGRCNLKCRHCYMESPSGKYGHCSLAEARRIVDQFAEAGVLEVSLTGGEPFMRKDILEILGMLAERRIWVSQIYSNGLLIEETRLEAIRKLGLKPAFQISFDGVGAHETMRGVAGIESPTIDAIRLLRRCGFVVAVSTSIDRAGARTLGETYELMKELRVASWRVSKPEPTGNWRGAEDALSLAELFDACRPVARRWSEDGKPFHILLAGFLKGAPDGLEGAPRRAIGYAPDSYACESCRAEVNLLPNGVLMPCPGYVDLGLDATMPNLLHGRTLSEVWADPAFRRYADLTLADVLAANPGCRVCTHFSECGVGCRASALARSGDLLAKDEMACVLYHQGYKARIANDLGAAAASI